MNHIRDLLPDLSTSHGIRMDWLPWVTREPTVLEKAWMAVTYPINLVAHPMDALMSIPALSFLVIPAFTSYGTSFNFLFFYLTWAILIRSNDPLKIEILGTLGVRLVFYLVPSLAFLVFDTATPNLAVGIKEHGGKALPMGEEQGGRRGRWLKITLISTLNILVGISIQIAIEVLFTKILRTRSALKITTTPPFPWSIAKDLFLGLLLREFFTYVLHRYLLHSPKSPLTKTHASWQHSIIAPFAFVAHFDHPLTYLIHVFLPTYIPALFLRMHLLTYHLYLAVVSLEEAFAYSGYNALPTAFILGGIARRQERHIMGKGDGNYGCFGLFDFLMGTSLGVDLLEDVTGEADEKQLGKRLRGKKKAVKKTTKKAIEHKAAEEDSDYTNKEEAEEDGESEEASEKESEEEAQDPPPKPRKLSGRSSKKSKKSNGEGTETINDVKDEKKPKRKASRVKIS